jgi:translation initiation factor 2 alpha subunit (eIF-2alpha)
MELEQDDIILCTVDRIVGTTVFVNIAGTNKEGSMVFSELAPGRIRNIRDYVVPKKTIVCKVLKITGDHIELSLRRVKEKERKEALEQHKIEKSYRAILKSVLKDKTPEIVEKIKEEDSIYNFLEKSKEDSKELEKIVGKENSGKILEILNSQKKKTIVLKKYIEFSTSNPAGITKIKNILGKIKEAKIRYLAAGKYSISLEDENIKNADIKISKIIKEIEDEGKKEGFEFKNK